MSAWVTLLGCARVAALVYVHARTGQSGHLGCAETSLQSIEHLLLPRALWCSEDRCWDQGAIELPVSALECTDDACAVELFCQQRATQALYGIAVTLVGVAIVFAWVCAPSTRPLAGKMHDQ